MSAPTECGFAPQMVGRTKKSFLRVGLFHDPCRRLMSSSSRLKRLWREHRKKMLTTLDKANAQASKRLHTRWRDDPEGMREIAIRNAAKGTAALIGTHYSPQRSRRASEGQRGKIMGGQLAKGERHLFAERFQLFAPDGDVHWGRNIIEFVRANRHLFDPTDLEWRRGHCRASKGLSRLRPTLKTRKLSWKGWTWC